MKGGKSNGFSRLRWEGDMYVMRNRIRKADVLC